MLKFLGLKVFQHERNSWYSRGGGSITVLFNCSAAQASMKIIKNRSNKYYESVCQNWQALMTGTLSLYTVKFLFCFVFVFLFVCFFAKKQKYEDWDRSKVASKVASSFKEGRGGDPLWVHSSIKCSKLLFRCRQHVYVNSGAKKPRWCYFFDINMTDTVVFQTLCEHFFSHSIIKI